MDRVDSGDPRYSTLPQAYDGSGLPEVYYPEAQSPQSPQIQIPYSYYNANPYIEAGKTEPASTVDPLPPQTKIPWWRRYWILLLVAAIVIAGALGGGLGGGLASRNNKKESTKSGSDSYGSNEWGYTTTCSTTTSTATSTSTSTSTSTAATSTATPGAHIYMGAVNISDVEWQIGFLPDQPCRYTKIVKTGTIPCERPFTLCDTVTYTWHGCGLDTWVTWGNDTDLGNCGLAPKTWTCGDSVVKGTWLCGS